MEHPGTHALGFLCHAPGPLEAAFTPRDTYTDPYTVDADARAWGAAPKTTVSGAAAAAATKPSAAEPSRFAPSSTQAASTQAATAHAAGPPKGAATPEPSRLAKQLSAGLAAL